MSDNIVRTITPNVDTSANKALSGWNLQGHTLADLVGAMINKGPSTVGHGPLSGLAVEPQSYNQVVLRKGLITSPIGLVKVPEQILPIVEDATKETMILVLSLLRHDTEDSDYRSIEGVDIAVFDLKGISQLTTAVALDTSSEMFNPETGDIKLALTDPFASVLTFKKEDTEDNSYWVSNVVTNREGNIGTAVQAIAFPLAFVQYTTAEGEPVVSESSAVLEGVKRFRTPTGLISSEEIEVEGNKAFIKGLDASKITTGKISVDRLPDGAFDKCVIVDTYDDMLALTKKDVKKGDTVRVNYPKNTWDSFLEMYSECYKMHLDPATVDGAINQEITMWLEEQAGSSDPSSIISYIANMLGLRMENGEEFTSNVFLNHMGASLETLNSSPEDIKDVFVVPDDTERGYSVLATWDEFQHALYGTWEIGPFGFDWAPDPTVITTVPVMYQVVDTTKLGTSAAFVMYTAGTASAVPWSGVFGRPEHYPASEHVHWKVREFTIQPSEWVTEGTDTKVRLLDSDIKARDKNTVRLSLSDSMDKDTRKVAARAKLFGTNQEAGHIDVYADGAKPKVEIKVLLEIEIPNA